MADAYAVADLVVSRAGMITVAEVCAWGLPWCSCRFRRRRPTIRPHNARAMAEAGAAVLVAQAGASADQLAGVLDGLLDNPGRRSEMGARALARGRPDAVRDIVSHLLTLVGDSRAFANRDKILALTESKMELFNAARPATGPLHGDRRGGHERACADRLPARGPRQWV